MRTGGRNGGRKPRVFTESELGRIRESVENGIALDSIAPRYDTTRKTITKLAKLHGWKRPSRKLKTTMLRLPGNPRSFFQLANLSRDTRREVEETERQLYGPLLDDVKFLRRRGFYIHRQGKWIMLGNRLVDTDRLVATAARERRLAGRA